MLVLGLFVASGCGLAGLGLFPLEPSNGNGDSTEPSATDPNERVDPNDPNDGVDRGDPNETIDDTPMLPTPNFPDPPTLPGPNVPDLPGTNPFSDPPEPPFFSGF